jgi:hypothetical protein
MLRCFAATAAILLCITAPGWSQSSSIAAGHSASAVGTPVPTSKTTTSGHCSIGVVSIVGILFQVEKVGFGSFGNEYHRVQVDRWGYDDLVVSRIRAAAPGQSVQRIEFDGRKELAREKQKYAGSAYDMDTALRDFTRRMAAGTSCDRYVLVHLDNGWILNSPEMAHGVGIINLPDPIQRHTYLFALTYIRVYDGRSFAILKQGAASTGDRAELSRFQGPKLEIEETAFPTNPTDAATNPAFREGVRNLLRTSLDKTLPTLLQ